MARSPGRQEVAHEVPVPRVPADAGARIFQRLELEPAFRQPHVMSIPEQSLTIRGDQMRHRSSLPDVAVQPEPAVHRVDHSVSTAREFTVRDAVPHYPAHAERQSPPRYAVTGR